jgi:hypothetical protein
LVDQPVNAGAGVLEGYWYQLGANLYAGGIRAVTAVAIKTGITTHILDTDYKLDATMARIYIIPGGAIVDGTVLTSNFTKTLVNWTEVAAANQIEIVRGRLRFNSANSAGSQRDLFCPDVILTPNGDYALKSRDTVQQMGFNCRVQVPSDGSSPIVITTRAV